MKLASMYKCIGLFGMICLQVGCTVGPDYNRPNKPEVTAYTASPFPEHTASAAGALGGAQRLVEGRVVNPQWWHELGSAKLDAMIDKALLASPTLAKAQATLRNAQEGYAARAGDTLPQLDASLGGLRQRFSPATSGQTGDSREFSLYSAGIEVNYQLDLAGSTRRALEALAANIDYQRYQLEGAQLTLVANIVTAVVTKARLAAQIQTTESILDAQEKLLGLIQERVRLGQATPDEVLAMHIEVEQTRANVSLLRNQLQRNDHLLAALVGQAPGEQDLPAISLQELTLPVDLPLTVPSELVRIRPDIQAAEALLHKANAEYGVAIANLYPQLNLSANLGALALTTGALFDGGSSTWSLISQLTQPLVNPGLPAEKRAALAALDAAAANYQYVVLESLRNVADVLRALENDAQRLVALSAADAAAQGFLESVGRKYELGAAGYIELLIAQQQSQQTRIALLEAQANRLVDSVAFYQAMGGGLANVTIQR